MRCSRWLGFVLCFAVAACGDTAQQPDNMTDELPVAQGTKPAAAVEPPTKKVAEGPFGLAMGQPVDQLEFVDTGEAEAGRARVLNAVPRPMGEFETYAVVAFPQTGICEIRAVSRTFESDAYGNNVKSAMDALTEALDTKYGKHRKTDSCSGYSCQFFQQNLNSGAQAYSYEWSAATGAKLTQGIGEVSLIAMPAEYNGTFFRLDYTSANRAACQAAARQAKAAAL